MRISIGRGRLGRSETDGREQEHIGKSRRAARRVGAVSLAHRLPPPAVPHRPQDQPVAERDRAAALPSGVRPRGGLGRHQGFHRRPRLRQFRNPCLRQHLPFVLSQKPRGGLRRDRDPAGDRLSDRLWHGARAAARAGRARDAGDPAVLDLVPDPRLHLDQHPADRRAAQPGAAGARPRQRAGDLARERHGDLCRHRLFLPAVHGAAALCGAREDGPYAARSGRRSWRLAACRVLARHRAAVAAGYRRRRAPVLHPDHRRVRDSRPAWRVREPDDRADAVDRVLLQQGLAGRLRDRGGPAVPAGRSDRGLPASSDGQGRKRRLTMRRGLSAFNLTSLALGLAFLYLPIAILVIYSFNASQLVTVWGGWSTRWYVALLDDRAMLDAAAASFGIAATSAAAATVLGTLAALALTRLGRFRGRLPFSAMIYAPLVMPEVITGLSLLLMFVAAGVDRGFLTVTAAHTTLTMCFVTVVVQSRLATFDRSLEEAAMDLGCPPARTFLTVTLPLIAPAVVAGFLLAFSLSLDDLVIASFTTGPGATTLPMRIYSEVRLGVKPEINAICTILVGVVALAIFAAAMISRRAAEGEVAGLPAK